MPPQIRSGASTGNGDFITQDRFTREYIRGALAKPEDRQAAISGLCEQVGASFSTSISPLGQHDFLLISEMPDARAASVVSLAASGAGRI